MKIRNYLKKDISMELIELPDDIVINGIFTLIYQEKGADFLFPGEKHDFWEFIYADKGFVYLLVEDKGYKLNQGEIFFFGRNQNHIVWSDSRTAPCFLTASFDMQFEDGAFFEHRCFNVDNGLKAVIKKILEERLNAFEGNIGMGVAKHRETPAMGSRQLIKAYLSELLIRLYRQDCMVEDHVLQPSVIRRESENRIFRQCVEFINENINNRLTLEQVCKSVHVSASHLNRIFNKNSGTSVMDYIMCAKLEKSKGLLRESSMNISQISYDLGFSSIHYFSRLFKQKYGITPREYSKSIKI